MKAEQELIGFLEHIGKTYNLNNEDYFNLEAWIQTIEAFGFGESEAEKDSELGTIGIDTVKLILSRASDSPLVIVKASETEESV